MPTIKMTGKQTLALGAVLVSLSLASVATAAQKKSQPVAGQADFDHAIALMTAGKNDEACPLLERSRDLNPAPGTLGKLGECYEKTGQLVAAWTAFEQARNVAHTMGQTATEQAAAAKAEALRPRLSFVTVTVPQPVPGLVVKRISERGSAEVPPSELGTQVPLDSGQYVFEATAPGKKTWQKTIVLSEGKGDAVEVPLLANELSGQAPVAALQPGPTDGATPNLVAPTVPQPQPTGAQGTFWTPDRELAVVVGGVGAVSLGIGSWIALSAKAKYNGASCDPNNQCNSRTDLNTQTNAIHRANWAMLPMGIGVAGIGTGIALWVTSPAKTGKEQSTPRLSLSSNAVTISGSF